MKKYLLCYSILLFACIATVQSQSVKTDYDSYFGTWTGADTKGNQYSLTLNSDWTMEMTINSEKAVSSMFKLDLRESVNNNGYGAIDLYAKGSALNTNATITFQDTPNEVLIQCGIIAYDGSQMSLQLDNGINRPTQFDVTLLVTLTK